MEIKRLSELNPDKFSIEDVMAIFGMWRWFAKLVMKTGVRRGEFSKDGEFYALIGLRNT